MANIKDNKILVEFLCEFDSELFYELKDEAIRELNLDDNLSEEDYFEAIGEQYTNEELQSIVNDTIYTFGDDMEWRGEAEAWLEKNSVK